MIEIVYNEKNQGSTSENEIFHLPNNIRQIGESKPHLKIYMEDYAYTFLKRMSSGNSGRGCAAILLGEAHWKDAVSYIFIRSALEAEDMEPAAEHLDFNDKVWSRLHTEMERYFPEQEIIGWSLSLPDFDMEISDPVLRTHLNHFAGNQKVLFVMEPTEKEEAFFVYENGRMNRQSGYYIYYEKNEPMQAYLIEKNANLSIEDKESVPDRAVIDFRKMTAEKKEKEQTGKRSRSYVMTVCTAAVLLLLCVTLIKHYRIVRETGEHIRTVETAQGQQEAEQEQKTEEKKLQSDMMETEENERQEEDDRSTESGSAGSEEAEGGDTESGSTESEEAGGGDTESGSAGSEEAGGGDAKSESAENGNAEPPSDPSAASAGAYRKYVVKKGDTLSKISQTYYGSLREIEAICQLNQLDSENLIYTGQIILLP